MFFVFDGEEFGRVSSLGTAVGEAKAAVACYEDQCDPDWPDETDSICYGIVLGGAVMREAGKGDDGSPTYTFEVADLWSEATVGAARKAEYEVDFESVVEVVGSWGQTMMPAILGVAAKECVTKAVFASPAMMLRFVVRAMRMAGAEPPPAVVSFLDSEAWARASEAKSSLKSAEECPDGLHKRYVVAKASGEPVDPAATYFTLRLDQGGDDKLHVAAGCVAAIAYCDYVQAAGGPLAVVAADLRKLVRELMGDAEPECLRGPSEWEFKQLWEEIEEGVPMSNAYAFNEGCRAGLREKMARVNMRTLPAVVPDQKVLHGFSDNKCVCGLRWLDHPLDWRTLDKNGQPVASVLCDGRRVDY